MNTNTTVGFPDDGKNRDIQKAGSQHSGTIRVMRPRVPSEVEQRVCGEAAICGEDCFYSWQVTNKKTGKKDLIEGVSINGAQIIARNFGNCSVEMGPLQELNEAWVFTATFIDQETGYALSRQYRQAKNKQLGGRMDEDAERAADLKFQIGQSKAIRNVILDATPPYLQQRVMENAKRKTREGIEKSIAEHGLEAVQKIAFAKLEKLGVPVDAVLFKFSRKAIAGLTVEDMVLIKSDLMAIASGAETPADLYPPRKVVAATAAGTGTGAVASSLGDLSEEQTEAGGDQPQTSTEASPAAGDVFDQ